MLLQYCFFRVGLDGLVGSDTSNSGFASLASSDPEAKQKLYGSGFLKQERPGNIDGDWRSSKLSKTESMLLEQSNTSPLKSNSNFLFADGQQQQQQQQILSFSYPRSAPSAERSSQNGTLPYFHLTSLLLIIEIQEASASTDIMALWGALHEPMVFFIELIGYSSGIYNAASMHGGLTETNGHSLNHNGWSLNIRLDLQVYRQQMCLYHSNLLIPIRKALDSAGFPSFSAGFFRPNTSVRQCLYFVCEEGLVCARRVFFSFPWSINPVCLGVLSIWGFSNNTDPEPGRCRRTDGKKWRAQDAVADQKYCERHMNRGRHRSRKPVEAIRPFRCSRPTTVKPANGTSSSTSSSVVGLRSTVCPTASLLLIISSKHEMFLTKENVGERTQDATALSMLRSTMDLKSKETPFVISKQQNSYGESLKNEFGLVTLRLPPQSLTEKLIFNELPNFGSSQDLTNQESVSQHSLRQFMDDWPKSQLHVIYFLPNNEKVTLSPLRLSREFDPIQMGLGVEVEVVVLPTNQTKGKPTGSHFLGTSMGGPLGEVLHNTNNNASRVQDHVIAEPDDL
ncbi:hypothetical protein POTOM_060342 [Populus tomentosa]|uniref:Growth-regulating factor n=1 Tax=Populus tomentosa TaxID=118781 RepID=A0A8X7Y076_POPTO|nr:hypothetical protein POTOM_060342 [Populus tomentosa]